MDAGLSSVLIVDGDIRRGIALKQTIAEQTGARTLLVFDLQTALQVIRAEHPVVIVVSENLGPAVPPILQDADEDAIVIVVEEDLAA